MEDSPADDLGLSDADGIKIHQPFEPACLNAGQSRGLLHEAPVNGAGGVEVNFPLLKNFLESPRIVIGVAVRQNDFVDPLRADADGGQFFSGIHGRVHHHPAMIDPEDQARRVGVGIKAVSGAEGRNAEHRRLEIEADPGRGAFADHHGRVPADGGNLLSLIVDADISVRVKPHLRFPKHRFPAPVRHAEFDEVVQFHAAPVSHGLPEILHLRFQVRKARRVFPDGKFGDRIRLFRSEQGLSHDGFDSRALLGAADDSGLAFAEKEIVIDGKFHLRQRDAVLHIKHRLRHDECAGHTPFHLHGVLDGFRWNAQLEVSAGRPNDHSAPGQKNLRRFLCCHDLFSLFAGKDPPQSPVAEVPAPCVMGQWTGYDTPRFATDKEIS
ncbi:MAG: hypothetical protein BWX45_00066 [Deltaproteobacteria bacterium ADurb.Bin002]|nr:MAG: hypothetical protein BWX45_00066 [Deltaproteobacteria bacterium ADurb.Bin002]